MKRDSLRRLLMPIVGAATATLWLAAMPSAGAIGTKATIEQFVGRAPSVSGAEDAGRIDIYILRWSTDEEMESLRRTFMENAAGQLVRSLQMKQRQRVGVVLMPGVQAHGDRVRTRTPRNLLLARQVVTPGGRQIILASDEHIGLGEKPLDARNSIPEFNVIDIRLGPDGTGVGKIVAAPDVAYSPATGTFEARNYGTQPARLIGVRSEQSSRLSGVRSETP